MQATLDSTGFKHLTRALICLSRFGEDVIIVANSTALALSATNTARSAFGRFKYPRSFFSKYRVDVKATDDDESPNISAQMALRPLLSILRHKTNEKACEKCELIITDGPSQISRPEDEDEERDSFESRLTVRLHCKHGVIKTHRLNLNQAENMAPNLPEPTMESRFTIGPKALRTLIDHFPFAKGAKADPQLVWHFLEDEVRLRSLQTATDTQGRTLHVTELTISAEEFLLYDLQTGPMTIAFHLREFNATIAFAEASQLSLEIRLTDPDDPIFISVDHELSDTLFVIAPTQVQSVSRQGSQVQQRSTPTEAAYGNARGQKRPLEDDSNQTDVHVPDKSAFRRERPKKPMRVVHQTDRASVGRDMPPPTAPLDTNPQPSWSILTAAQQRYQDDRYDYEQDQGLDGNYDSASASQLEVGRAAVKGKGKEKEPLFLPGSQLSQLPPDVEQAIIDSGLGIEHMTVEEFEAMLEGDAEEVEFGSTQQKSRTEEGDDRWEVGGDMDFGVDDMRGGRSDSFELVDDVEMAPTQRNASGKEFRPLFED